MYQKLKVDRNYFFHALILKSQILVAYQRVAKTDVLFELYNLQAARRVRNMLLVIPALSVMFVAFLGRSFDVFSIQTFIGALVFTAIVFLLSCVVVYIRHYSQNAPSKRNIPLLKYRTNFEAWFENVLRVLRLTNHAKGKEYVDFTRSQFHSWLSTHEHLISKKLESLCNDARSMLELTIPIEKHGLGTNMRHCAAECISEARELLTATQYLEMTKVYSRWSDTVKQLAVQSSQFQHQSPATK